MTPLMMISLLVAMIFVIVFVPAIVIAVMWLKGFNRRAFMIKQTGESLKNADFKMVKCKVVKDPKLGEIIKFFPGGGYDVCKRYPNKYWVPLVRNGKVSEAIILHVEQDNYHPCLVADGKVVIDNVDNGEFLLYKDLVRGGASDDRKLYAIIVVSFVIFALVFGVACLTVILYLTKMNMVEYATILSKGVVPLA